MKYLYIYFLLFSLVGCKSESKEQIQEKAPVLVEKAPEGKSPLWKEVCNLNKFGHMYDCSQGDCYQIELSQDLFKEFVFITIDISDSTKDIIYHNRLRATQSPDKYKKNKKYTDFITIVNPLTKDSTYLFFKKTSKIIIKPKNIEINNFLSNTIWSLPLIDAKNDILDPEIWEIKGRSEGKEVELSRTHFKPTLTLRDSQYFTNIQKILDICKIKDYKYGK